jgi:alpha-beta hydrolase superfamily lysophospholipase
MTIEERKLSIVCDGLRLAGGAFVPSDPRGTVMLLHGIPSVSPPDPSDLGYPGVARRLAEKGWAGAWLNLRGAKGSPGFFSIEGWVRDARAAVDAARAIDGLASLPLALVGSSAGGSVATEAVERGAPVDALGLLAAPATWVSFADDPATAVRRITEEAGMPLSEEVRADPAIWAGEFGTVVTEEAIVNIRVPVLIVHGSLDDVVPVEHAHRLAERARDAELVIIDGGVHQLRRDERALAVVEDWLERSLKRTLK